MIDEILDYLKANDVKILCKYKMKEMKGIVTEFFAVLHNKKQERLEVAFLIGTDLNIVAESMLILQEFDLEIKIGEPFLYVGDSLVTGQEAIDYYEQQKINDIIAKFIRDQQNTHSLYFSIDGEA